jgi:general secretion pathway protein D
MNKMKSPFGLIICLLSLLSSLLSQRTIAQQDANSQPYQAEQEPAALAPMDEVPAAQADYYPPQNPAPARMPAIGSPGSTLSFYTYKLSYMQSDRVLGLLKALGYATVEYSISQGESLDTYIYNAIQQIQDYPLIIKMIDAGKTSLMQPALDGGVGEGGANSLGGTYLHQQTTGAPEQRLFIVYEKAAPEQLHALLQLMRNEIDVAASQMVIEALVVEINTAKAKELGFSYSQVDKKTTSSQFSTGKFSSTFRSNENSLFSFGTSSEESGSFLDTYGDLKPKLGVWSRTAPLGLSASISAFVEDGHAEILSNPSVLVLDGRQARIQVGQQVPTSNVSTSAAGSYVSVSYIQTGIVLNIRPRISEDGSEITMQIETIVSSAETSGKTDTGALLAPEIENKQVQTFVRVADNTPFIVGGLISKKDDKDTTGIPILSDIPILGNLFKKKTSQNSKREVIIVLTPHVINTNDKSFSYVIPKDSQSFDSFDNLLFRNAYRIRDDDLFDLSFATKSDYYLNILKDLKDFKDNHIELPEEEPVFGFLDKKVPGEEVIVRRMIWEIVHKSKYHEYITDDHILVFESNEAAKFGNKFKTNLLSVLLDDLVKNKKENSLVLDFADHKAKTTGPFEHPRALITKANVKDPSNYVEQISLLNADDPDRNTILLSSSIAPPGVRRATALEVLKGVLVLKRILSLNSSMPVTIKEFRVGRQIIFPTEQELKDKYHIIDYDVARFFYEIINYYPEFERAFNRDAKAIVDRMSEDSNTANTLDYYLSEGDETTGPFTLEQLSQSIAEGYIKADDWVCLAIADAEWETAGEAEGLKDLFKAPTKESPATQP